MKVSLKRAISAITPTMMSRMNGRKPLGRVLDHFLLMSSSNKKYRSFLVKDVVGLNWQFPFPIRTRVCILRALIFSNLTMLCGQPTRLAKINLKLRACIYGRQLDEVMAETSYLDLYRSATRLVSILEFLGPVFGRIPTCILRLMQLDIHKRLCKRFQF